MKFTTVRPPESCRAPKQPPQHGASSFRQAKGTLTKMWTISQGSCEAVGKEVKLSRAGNRGHHLLACVGSSICSPE